MSEDPFSCFGEEDGDDTALSLESQPEDQPNSLTRTKELIDCANQRFYSQSFSRCSSTPTENAGSSTVSAIEEETIIPSEPFDSPWPHRPPPLYRHPALILQTSKDGIGGGRGYVAACDLAPGTLLLLEQPVSTLDGFYAANKFESELGIETLHCMLFHKNDSIKTRNLIHDMELLHPTKAQVHSLFGQGPEQVNHHLTHISPIDDTTRIPEILQIQIMDRIHDMLILYSTHPLMTEILDSLNNTMMDDSKTLKLYHVDICRMILVLRYNCFESGLYLHFSMFNHSESSNCIKYMPNTQDHAVQSRHCSEARTTRPVAKGESLTMNYIPPHREVSHATRRRYLWDQHRFDIGHDTIPLHVQEMEYIISSLGQKVILSPSSIHDLDTTTITFGIEKNIVELEEKWSILHKQSQTTFGDDEELALRIVDVEAQTSNCISQSSNQLGNPQHILLLRLYRLHVDILDWILKNSSSIDIHDTPHMDRFSPFIHSTRTFLHLQIQAYGPDHPDVARTHEDIAHALSFLLSHSPQEWFRRQVQGLSTLMECSKVEAYHRKEYHRIKNLYPHDVDLYMKSSC